MDVYVARQPIFNKRKRIYGYELLFRDGMVNAFPDVDGDAATSRVLSTSFLSNGIERITGRRKAFVNFTEKMITEKIPAMFPKKTIMVEILEDIEPNAAVVTACRGLAEQGYNLVLDDFIFKPEMKPLLPLAGIVKFDFRVSSIKEIEESIKDLAAYQAKLLAEKIETHEEFQQALDMGFDYFQGYFFSKPEIIKSRDIPPSKITLLNIMSEANREDFRMMDLENFVSRDLSVNYKLMRYINSAYFGMVKRVSSVKQTIVLLGIKEIRRFLSLIAMAQLVSGKPDELIRASLIRARFCENLGKGAIGKDDSELFTLGLFSFIDAILDNEMGNIMEKLPLSENIKNALTGDGGELADYLTLVSYYENGDWGKVASLAAKTGIDGEKVPEFYMDAVAWADSVPI
ncbi:MAG: HDOD domain-containing protein [Deltaproteobacteria bacterium]|nr:HDOD domain-containing protein [Deltaproteobacteria bacterium]